jgi:hypothetical protein
VAPAPTIRRPILRTPWVCAAPCALARRGSADRRCARKFIIDRFINSCWSLFKRGLIVALLGATAAGAWFYARMDDEICDQCSRTLAKQFPELEVRVGGARRVPGKGIIIYDLELAERGGKPGEDPLVAIDEITLTCDVEIAALIHGVPEIRRVELRRPKLSLRRRTSGSWNVAALLPKTPRGAVIPEIIVRDGSVRIADDAASKDPPLVLGDVELTLKPTGPPAPEAPWPTVAIDATIGGPQLKRAELHLEADGERRLATAKLSLAEVQLKPALMAWVYRHLPPATASPRLTGTLDGTAEFTWQLGAAPTGSATLTLNGGRLEDPRLPRPVTELTGRVIVAPDRLRIEEMTGKCGVAAVALSLNRLGWTAGAPAALSARVVGAPLDAELYAVLPQMLRTEWDKFSPTGVVDATLQAAFDGQTWQPVAANPGEPAARLVGRDLSFASDKYAYRLHGGSGTINFVPAQGDQPPRLDADMTANGGGQPLHIVAQVFDPRPDAAGWAEITGQNLQIEQAMIDAMPEKARDVVTQLHPAGRMNVRWRIERPQLGAVPRKTLKLDLTDVRIKYEGFPYRLEGIRGQIAAVDDRWTFTDLVSSGQRTIRGDGHLQPCEQGTEFFVRLTGERVPLDRTLFDAFREPVQQAWQQLRPNGEVDLAVEVLHRTGQGLPNIGVKIQPRPESAHLRPVFFDYRLEQIAGVIQYRDGHVSLQGMTAQHDGTIVGGNGAGYFGSDGGWEFRLAGLRADNVTPSADLIAALPPQLGNVIQQIEPTGVFTLHNSELIFRKPASSITAVQCLWDVNIDCHRADLHCGLDLQNIHGSVRLTGQSDGQQAHSAGELNLESVSIQDVQFTDVHGPLWIDQGACRLGKWASERQPNQPARRLAAKVYGGTLAADAWIKFDARPQYGVAANLSGADLHRLLVERFGSQQAYQGKVDANVMIGGEGPSIARLRGEGDVHIRDANIYETTLLVGLLKFLRTGENDRTAFNQSNVKFRIQGPHITLDQLDFLGDGVNLYGQGVADFDQRLNLVFSPSIIRQDSPFPLVGSLMRQAGSQSMRIYVDGTLSNPHPTSEPLPGIKQMVEQIRADLEDPISVTTGRQAQVPAGPFQPTPR